VRIGWNSPVSEVVNPELWIRVFRYRCTPWRPTFRLQKGCSGINIDDTNAFLATAVKGAQANRERLGGLQAGC